MLKHKNKKLTFSIKFVATVIFLTFLTSTANSQSVIEKALIKAGFENVREISKQGKEQFYLEGTVFVTKERAFKAIRDVFQIHCNDFNNDKIEVIFLERGIPVYKYYSSKQNKGDNGQIIWRSDPFINEKTNVLSNIDGKKGRFYNESKWRADLKFYPQFRFKNSRLDRMYVLQLNLNPTLELSLWRGALLTAQIILPVYDEYSNEESRVRPGFFTFSQQLKIPGNIHLLATIGNFNMFRSGGDLKIFKPISKSVGIYGQVGVTGWSLPLFDKWLFYDFGQISWRFGANYSMPSKNILFNLNLTQYLENDFAVRGEIIRYFKNAAVGFYVQSLQYEDYLINGGFFFSISLPPYKHNRNKRVRVSTADHFSIEYIARPYPQRGRMYFTSPDESSSFNFFNRILINN